MILLWLRWSIHGLNLLLVSEQRSAWKALTGTLSMARDRQPCIQIIFGCSVTRGEGALKPHARDLDPCNGC